MQLNSPFDVFHAVAEIAFQVYGIDNGRNTEELLSELCGDESLAEVGSMVVRLFIVVFNV